MSDHRTKGMKSAAPLEAVQEAHEPFETGELGRDPQHFEKAPADLRAQVDASLEMQMVSVRLPKQLISELKLVADYRGIGYQPLMRDILQRFARCEISQIAKELVEQERDRQAIEAARAAKLKRA